MRNRLWLGITLVLFFCFAPAAAFAQEPVASRIQFTADLGPAGTAQLSALVLTRTGPPAGETVLIVPGFAQTAETFRPLGRALFDGEFGNKIERVVVLDLPGHGLSGHASGLPFGILTTPFYVAAVLEALEALEGIGTPAGILIGHSLGGEIVQLAQQQLVSAGSSLREAFGIRGVVLLAPAIPAPVPWAFATSGAAIPILLPWVVNDPVLGPIVSFPPPVWVAVFYSNLSGVIPAGAPTPSEAQARGYISIESGFIGLEITGTKLPGLPPFDRPEIDPGLFRRDRGTALGVIAVSQDTLFLPEEERALYAYLTADADLKFFTLIEGDGAVHNLHTFDTAPFVHSIKKVLNNAQAMN